MYNDILVDNDIVIKASSYSLSEEFITEMRRREASIWVLGVASYVVVKQLQKSKRLRERERAIASANAILGSAKRIEPSDTEIILAAELEEAALRAGLPLDAGESQLVAVLASRQSGLLLTGDKRAVIAAHQLASGKAWGSAVAGRIACLEQLIRTLIDQVGSTNLTSKICAEPDVDRTLAMCFSCSSESLRGQAVMDGLESYLGHLRGQSGGLLLPGSTL